MSVRNRVFPFFFNGGIQKESPSSGDTIDWNGTSSYVEVALTSGTATVNIGKDDSYGRPVPHGAMLIVRKVSQGYAKIKVDWSHEFSDQSTDPTQQSAKLFNVNDAVLLLWKGPEGDNKYGEWVNLTSDTTEGNLVNAEDFALAQLTGSAMTPTVANLVQDRLIEATPDTADTDTFTLPATADLVADFKQYQAVSGFITNTDDTFDMVITAPSDGNTTLVGSTTVGESKTVKYTIVASDITDSSERAKVYIETVD